MVKPKDNLPEDGNGVWHPGELELQRRIDVVGEMAAIGQLHVRDFMPEQHREFFSQLPFIVLGTVDDTGCPWAGLRCGEPGFVSSPDPHRLCIADMGNTDDPTDGDFPTSDPMEKGLVDTAAIGLLGIELHTRRRNRMNGVVNKSGDGTIEISVRQSFGNCPQYIQLRRFERSLLKPGPVERLDRLDEQVQTLIETADTFFVTTYADRPDGRQVDVSHRGGRPGFVSIAEDGVLTVPDFAGNHFFATLGNILLNGRAGITFVDFSNGSLLQMTGRAEILDSDKRVEQFEGAERLWRFRAEQIVRRIHSLPIRFAFEQWSTQVLETGNWEEVSAREGRALLGKGWQPLRVTRIMDESPTIRSLYLSPIGNVTLIRPQAGQHLPIRLSDDAMKPQLMRTYTISSAPYEEEYRISVKRKGYISNKLHSLNPGDIVEAKVPAGQFTVDALDNRPVVLLGAGVGITPMIAMLHHIVFEGTRVGRIRQTRVFQSAHSKAELVFADELAELVAVASGAVQHIRVLSKTEGALEGHDYDVTGRIDVELVLRKLLIDDAEFYLCGPATFMQSLYDGLRDQGVADELIHAEVFDSETLERKQETGSASELLPPAREPVEVRFAASLKKAIWIPGSGNLLELAEASGVSPPSSCRGGSCGSCLTSLLEGSVTYDRLPEYHIENDEVLLCQALPVLGSQRLVIDI